MVLRMATDCRAGGLRARCDSPRFAFQIVSSRNPISDLLISHPMRVSLHRRLVLAAAALAVGATMASVRAARQGMGGMGGGGMGGGACRIPGAIFKKEKESEIVGLSLAATDEPVIDVRIVGNKLIPIVADSQRDADPRRPAVRSDARAARRPQAGQPLVVRRGRAGDREDARGPHRDDQSRRAADDSLHRIPGQRRRDFWAAAASATRSWPRRPGSRSAARSTRTPSKRPAASSSPSTAATASTTPRFRCWKATSRPTRASCS